MGLCQALNTKWEEIILGCWGRGGEVVAFLGFWDFIFFELIYLLCDQWESSSSICMTLEHF